MTNEAPTPRTDALLQRYLSDGDNSRLLVMYGVLVEHAHQLERELAHMQRMYECAQNANAYRQAALEVAQAALKGK